MVNNETPSKKFIGRLVDLAVAGLEPMYDSHKNLFTSQIEGDSIVHMNKAGVITYTAITLIGLSKIKDKLSQTPFDWQASLTALVSQIDHLPRIGDLGLVLWADACYDSGYAPEIMAAIRRQLNQYPAESLDTMELAWLLTGLSYAAPYLPTDAELSGLAAKIYYALMDNSSHVTGFFIHAPPRKFITRLRSNIGTFADQIYPVYALSAYYEYSREDTALEQAIKCARRLCRLQGEQGQWWWHYNYKTGQIAEKYPVYAVHQDGLAIMAMLKIASISTESVAGYAWRASWPPLTADRCLRTVLRVSA